MVCWTVGLLEVFFVKFKSHFQNFLQLPFFFQKGVFGGCDEEGRLRHLDGVTLAKGNEKSLLLLVFLFRLAFEVHPGQLAQQVVIEHHGGGVL